MRTTNKHKTLTKVRRLIERRTFRYETNLTVLEGPKLVAEALASKRTLLEAVVAPGVDSHLLDCLEHDGVRIVWVDAGVISKLGDTANPQPILAVCEISMSSLTDIGDSDFVVVGIELNDPGNLGTIIRSADSAGAQAVILSHGSVDPFAPKVLRAGAGSHFHLKVIQGPQSSLLLRSLGGLGFERLATVVAGGEDLFSASFSSSTALVVGNEARGLAAGDLAECDRQVSIPNFGKSESLNVSTAATLALYEIARRRHSYPK